MHKERIFWFVVSVCLSFGIVMIFALLAKFDGPAPMKTVTLPNGCILYENGTSSGADAIFCERGSIGVVRN